MTILSHQPDDPGAQHHADPYAPLSFGTVQAEFNPATLRMIKRNAGRVPAVTIAQALCWSLNKLQRHARAHGIELRTPALRENEPRGA